jgi:hypothetical protein
MAALLKLTEEQLALIQKALDFYSRIGIGQMEEILSHPTYYEKLRDELRPKKKLDVGDRTERGEIVEIGEGFIKTKGSWGNGEETRTWQDVEKIKLSVDYGRLREIEKIALEKLREARNLILLEDLSHNSYYSIHNDEVDESCRIAFDLVQVIRHEFWKKNPDRGNHTVDSSVNIWTAGGHGFSCYIEDNK